MKESVTPCNYCLSVGKKKVWIKVNVCCFPGHGWGAAEESHGDGGYGESPVSFEGGDHTGYGLAESEDVSYGSDIGHGGYWPHLHE